MELVKILDGITRYRFGMSAEVMDEWKSSRQVPGQPHGGSTPKADTGEGSPGPGGIDAPAA